MAPLMRPPSFPHDAADVERLRDHERNLLEVEAQIRGKLFLSVLVLAPTSLSWVGGPAAGVVGRDNAAYYVLDAEVRLRLLLSL